jgi:predicted MFS family arabinose efflux permease
LGMASVTVLFAGQFALFTYTRPFLETVTRMSVPGLSLILLAMGVAGVAGTWTMGLLLRRRPRALLIWPSFLLAMIAFAVVAFGQKPLPTALLLAAWGMISTGAPVAWWTWLSKTLPDDAEAGGGLMVAAIQLAITLGAALGGLLVDSRGYGVAFGAAGVILCGAGVLAAIDAWRTPGKET